MITTHGADRRRPVTATAALMRAIADAGLELIAIDPENSQVLRIGTLHAAAMVVQSMPRGWRLAPVPQQLAMGL